MNTEAVANALSGGKVDTACVAPCPADTDCAPEISYWNCRTPQFTATSKTSSVFSTVMQDRPHCPICRPTARRMEVTGFLVQGAA